MVQPADDRDHAGFLRRKGAAVHKVSAATINSRKTHQRPFMEALSYSCGGGSSAPAIRRRC